MPTLGPVTGRRGVCCQLDAAGGMLNQGLQNGQLPWRNGALNTDSGKILLLNLGQDP